MAGDHTFATGPYTVNPSLAQHLDEIIAELRDRSIAPQPANVLRYALELGLGNSTASNLTALLKYRIKIGATTMTDSLEEAFAAATLEFLDWYITNKHILDYGIRHINEDGQEGYAQEPTVPFAGQDLLISTICEHAMVLSGKLPPFLKRIFDIIADIHGGGAEVNTYEGDGAVELLQLSIYVELGLQKIYPMPGPTRLQADFHHKLDYNSEVLKHAILARPRQPCIDLLRLTREEWAEAHASARNELRERSSTHKDSKFPTWMEEGDRIEEYVRSRLKQSCSLQTPSSQV